MRLIPKSLLLITKIYEEMSRISIKSFEFECIR